MLKHETELLEDKGFDYRSKITAVISLTSTHYSSTEISQIMRLTHRQLVSLMKQNPRLPQPYDWKDDFSEEELKRMKRVVISDLIFQSDDLYDMNQQVMSDYLQYGRVRDDMLSEIRALNQQEFYQYMSKLNLQHRSVVVIEPLKG